MSLSSKATRITLGILSILLAISCSPLPQAPEAELALSIETGTRVSIYGIAPAVLASFEELGKKLEKVAGFSPAATARGSSRAFIKASRAEVRLLDAEAEIIDSVEVSKNDFMLFMTGSSEVTADLLAAPGSGYVVEVDIFNEYVSDSLPVCSGSSAAFSITAGAMADVGVVCLPNNPEPLGETPLTVDLLPGEVLYPDSFQLKEEAWYSFTALCNSQTLRVSPASPYNQGFTIMLYGSDGRQRQSYSWTFERLMGVPSPAYYDVSLPVLSGQDYYLGCVAYDFTFGPVGTVYAGAFDLRLITPVVQEISGTADSGPCLLQNTGTALTAIVSSGAASLTLTLATLDPAATISLDGLAEADNILTLGLDAVEHEIVVEDSEGRVETYSLNMYVGGALSSGVQDVVNLAGTAPAYRIMAVSGGESYSIRWDDSKQGSGSFTADCRVSAYGSSGDSFIERIDSGYIFVQAINTAADEDYVFICVEKFLSGDMDGNIGLTVTQL